MMTLRSSILGVFGRGHAEPATDPDIATDPGRLEAWMTSWIAAKAKIDAAVIDRNKLFTDFGLDSLLAVNLSGALEQLLARPLSPSIAWEYPTMAELAAYLAAGGSGAEHDMDVAEAVY
jgi:acyl carrier protein